MLLVPRQKKLIGLIVFLPLMLIYLGMVLLIADRLPAHWAVYLFYFIVMGVVWVLPLKPAMIWMNTDDRKKDSDPSR